MSTLYPAANTPTFIAIPPSRLCDPNSKHRFQSAKDYIDALLTCYSRLLVIRVDLSYHQQHPAYPSITADVAREHIAKLLSNRRHNALFENMVGYVIRLEYGLDKGWHFHCLFFFNGQNVQNERYYSQALGQYWVSMLGREFAHCDTSNQGLYQYIPLGLYFDCHRNHYPEGYDAIGRLDYDNVDKIQVLTNVVTSYLAKTVVESVASIDYGGGRVFWRGEMPQSSGLGRPRSL